MRLIADKKIIYNMNFFLLCGGQADYVATKCFGEILSGTIKGNFRVHNHQLVFRTLSYSPTISTFKCNTTLDWLHCKKMFEDKPSNHDLHSLPNYKFWNGLN